VAKKRQAVKPQVIGQQESCGLRGLIRKKGGAAVKAASSYCVARANAATGSIVTGMIPARLMSS
jgi:hypothetical protein